jgi:lysophospholipase L1-like esterase
MSRSTVYSLILLCISTLFSVAAAEAVLRIKNSSMTNYDIEMWRYAKELKYASPDPLLGHDHLHNASAVLQSVTIRTNEWGLRGGPVAPRKPNERRILFLGSSITLGWGVAEADTESAQLTRLFNEAGRPAEVLNGGVGNYNAVNYVQRFFAELKDVEPTDIVVQYFLRDAEDLDRGGGNFFLRHSELAVTLWIAATRVLDAGGEKSLGDHYAEVYRGDQPGYQAMLVALKKLADYARARKIRLYMAMTPDIHNLKDYQFGFIHQTMRMIAEEDGYTFIDLLPAFGQLPPDRVWAMPGDPHPNALGHKLMAETIFSVLNDVP